MKRWWLSWYEQGPDYRPLADPPNEAVCGWWCSGETSDGQYFTLCAVVDADTEQHAKDAIYVDWPEAGEWRFVEERAADYQPNNRFPVTRDWERERLGRKEIPQ